MCVSLFLHRFSCRFRYWSPSRSRKEEHRNERSCRYSKIIILVWILMFWMSVFGHVLYVMYSSPLQKKTSHLLSCMLSHVTHISKTASLMSSPLKQALLLCSNDLLILSWNRAPRRKSQAFVQMLAAIFVFIYSLIPARTLRTYSWASDG